MLKNFQALVDKAKQKGKITVAVATAHDESVLGAVKLAVQEGFMQPILIGEQERIKIIAQEIGLNEDMQIIDVPDPEQAAAKAVELVRQGEAQALMKGLVNTAVFLRAVLKMDTGENRPFLSHLAVFSIPGQEKLLFMTDVAFNSYPDLEQKKKLLVNAINALHRLGYARPNVAILSANEVPNPKIPAAIDAQTLVRMNGAGGFPAANMEGPMALDVIASKECAEHKNIKSEIAGDVDLILVPDIEVGNGIAKAFSHYADATMAGIVLGAQVPVILNSRSDSAEGKFISITLALLLDKFENTD